MEEALAAYRRASAAHAELRHGVVRSSAGAAQSRSLLRGFSCIRRGRSARQPGGSSGQRLPAVDAWGLRTRTGGIREALAQGKVARRRARKALRDLEGADPARRARPCAQRSRSRRYDPVLSLFASDGRRGRRYDLRMPAEAASAPLFEGQCPIRQFAAGGGAVRRTGRDQQLAARIWHAARDDSGCGPLSCGRAGPARNVD